MLRPRGSAGGWAVSHYLNSVLGKAGCAGRQDAGLNSQQLLTQWVGVGNPVKQSTWVKEFTAGSQVAALDACPNLYPGKQGGVGSICFCFASTLQFS